MVGMSTAENRPNRYPIRMTEAEYLDWEAEQPRPHEYYDGQVHPRHGDAVAQAGASRDHNRIVANLVWKLKEHLQNRPCDVFASDMRLALSPQHSYYYPDVMVACDPIELVPNTFDTLVNPKLIVEVLSRSTQAIDIVRKRSDYRNIPSLIDYVLIDQYRVGVERLTRMDDGNHWQSTDFTSLDDEIQLPSIGGALRIADIYYRIDLTT